MLNVQCGTFEKTVAIDLVYFLSAYCYSLVVSYSYNTMVLLSIKHALFSPLQFGTLVDVVTQSSSNKRLRSTVESFRWLQYPRI